MPIDPSGDDPLLGRRFGSYVVEEKLGEGGMGVVYRAVQPEIGKQVAIKFLAPHFSQNPGVVQRFFAEARAVNLIQHDNIVDIFDFGQIDGRSFFVMELMKGVSLEALLQAQGRLAIGRSLDVALQMADAISAAHAHNIIHRDLKPDNVYLVTRSGRTDFVKLLDFGIAKLADSGGSGESLSRTLAGAVLGTPGYMSPEQGTGGTVDGRTDVYALGVILFRMLSGRLPFEGATFPEILQKQLIEPAPDLRVLRAELPLPLAQLVHQMVAREVADRPQAMAQVVERLSPLLSKPGEREASQPMRLAGASALVSVVGVGPPSTPGRTTLSGATGQRAQVGPPTWGESPIRRKPSLALGVGAALTLLVAGALWLGLGKKSAEDPPRTVQATRPTAAPAVAAQAPPATRTPAVAPSFSVYVETEPEGAQMFAGGKLLGTTPGRIELPGESASLRLRLFGYREERLDVSDGEHQLVRLHKESAVHLPPARLPAPPPVPATHPPLPRPVPKKPAIGLDD